MGTSLERVILYIALPKVRSEYAYLHTPIEGGGEVPVLLFCFLPLCWKLLKGRVGLFNPHSLLYQTQLKPNIFSRRRKSSWDWSEEMWC